MASINSKGKPSSAAGPAVPQTRLKSPLCLQEGPAQRWVYIKTCGILFKHPVRPTEPQWAATWPPRRLAEQVIPPSRTKIMQRSCSSGEGKQIKMKLCSIRASRQRQAVQLADEQRNMNRSCARAAAAKSWQGLGRRRAAASAEGLRQRPVTRETVEIWTFVEDHLACK